MKNHFVDLIEDTHKLVQAMRMKKNLPPYPFDVIKEHVVDPFAIVHEVTSDSPRTVTEYKTDAQRSNKYNDTFRNSSIHERRQAIAKAFPSDERKEMPDHGFKTISDVECACGCKNLIGAKAAAKGWKFIYGHKGLVPTKAQQLDRQAKATKQNGPVNDLSPKKMIAVFEAERIRISNERAICMENCTRIGTTLVKEQTTLANLEKQFMKIQHVIHAIEALSLDTTSMTMLAVANQIDRGEEYVAN